MTKEQYLSKLKQSKSASMDMDLGLVMVDDESQLTFDFPDFQALLQDSSNFSKQWELLEDCETTIEELTQVI